MDFDFVFINISRYNLFNLPLSLGSISINLSNYKVTLGKTYN